MHRIRVANRTGARASIITMDARRTLTDQYHASLAMLADAIRRCPDDLWTDAAYPNKFWHVAYHALFFAHLYLQKDVASFVAWEHHRAEYQFLGPLPWPPHRMPNIGAPYTTEEALDFWELCDAMVDNAVSQMDLEAADSGFWWYKVSKLEHQIINIRHIQHHAGQLADRLRSNVRTGVEWIGGKPAYLSAE